MGYQFLADFTLPYEKWDSLDTIGHPYGHTLLAGYMGLRPRDPVTVAHEESLTAVHGEKRMDEILSTNVHHVLVYLLVGPTARSTAPSGPPLGCEQDAYRNLAFQTEKERPKVSMTDR